MSTSLAAFIEGQIEISHPEMGLVVVTADGQSRLGFVHNLDERTWLDSICFASHTVSKFQFVLGDLMLRGAEAFGEDAYAKASPVAGRDPESLRHYAWVAKRVPEIARNNNLSFNHHRQVAVLELGEQMAWLARAEREGLSVVELKKAIRAARPSKPAAPNTMDTALTDALVFIEKRLAALGSGENSKFFLCQLIQELEAKLNYLDGVRGTESEPNEFD
jgi:hypothetical protein